MVYIALGSNIGNRFVLLQKAVDCIGSRIGTILSVSKVYESDAFLNACIKIKTDQTALDVLDVLLTIENELGRNRDPNEGYQARPIDLDILLFNNEIISHERLQLPHPRMELRQFVLTPLADIAAKKAHPQFKKSIEDLQQKCEDNSVLSIWNEPLKF
jgi:deoxyguanosine kinase